MTHEFRDPAIRVTLLPRDTNAHGTIFGGIILSQIDTAGAVGVHRLGVPRVVTVAMNGVIFHQAVFVGDLLSLYVDPVRVGRTSLTVHVRVEAERAGQIGMDASVTRVRVTEAEVVYVAVDEARRPVSIAHLKNHIETLIAARAAKTSPSGP